MKYIWLNPVVEAMYKPKEHQKFLEDLGFSRMGCQYNHGAIVLEKYNQVIKEHPDKIIVDMRCPKAIEEFRRFEDETRDEKFFLPEIEPILIHAARELSARLKKGDICLITTPCEALAEQGRKLRLQRVVFMTWKDFLREHQIQLNDLPASIPLDESPVPPGFFMGITKKCDVASGVEAIKSTLEKVSSPHYDKPRIVEMLYCLNGCHNGDGVYADRQE